MNTLDLLQIATAIVPDRVALVAGDQGERTTTFAEIENRAARLASGLAQLGVVAGDRVAMIDVNVPEYCETYFACAMLDAVFVPINYRVRFGELSWLLGQLGPHVIVAGRRYVGLVNEARDAAKSACRGVIIGEATSWASYEGEIASCEPFPGTPSGSGADPTMILFTSGTSAHPKGVVLSHSSFCGYVTSNLMPADLDPESLEKTILTVPLYHVAGAQALMAGIYGGRTLVLQSQFNPEGWLRLVESQGVNRAMLVPTMLKSLIELETFENRDLSTLKVVTYGAAAMPVEVLETAMKKLPGVQFINAFGQTETAATITMLSPEDHVLEGDADEVAGKRKRLRSIGRPLPDVEVRIVDESETEVQAGVTGEIVARGERLMTGYWNSPRATADTIHNGWLHTGDLGWRDDDGYIFLAGRAGEFIKRGGEMISPEEVEETLCLHPAVAESAVIGVEDATWGEVVHAAVVLTKGAAVSGEELIEFCQRRIASFKKPEVVHFVDELPVNQLGKVMRSELRERFRSDA